MVRVEYAHWGPSPEDLRRLAMSAPHARTRERALALYDIAQGSCATRVAGRTDAIPRPSWVGCTPITHGVLTLSGFAAPAADPPLREDCGGASDSWSAPDGVCPRWSAGFFRRR